MTYNTIIIGAGAAGLFAGTHLHSGNNLILEAGKRAGEKILITGGGMCNITNMDDSDTFLTHFGDRKKLNFLKPSILNWSTENTRDWLEECGTELLIRDDGKVFPASLKAQTFIDTMLREISRNKTPIHYKTKVTNIQYRDGLFFISTNERSYQCSNIIIATGGKSYPETGSDGSLYPILKNLGHNITPLKPALTGIKIENYHFKTLAGSGVRNTLIDCYREGKRILQTSGDILFTHQGLSGPAIINNSRNLEVGDTLHLSLTPCNNREEKRLELQNILNNPPKYTVKRLLKELQISNSLSSLLLNQLEIPTDELCNRLNKKSKKRLISAVVEYKFTIKHIIGYHAAMVTSGGVDLKDINRKTMESKLIPHLYFAGEVMDIDGDTGGYNIQVALSTAKLITDALKR